MVTLRVRRSGRLLRSGHRGTEVASLIAYLRRYGYLQPSEHPQSANWNRATAVRLRREVIFDAGVQAAVARYQAAHSIATTGEIDAATRRHMTSPRCGRPDSSTMVGGAAAAGLNTGGVPWPTRQFRYRFVNEHPELVPADVHQGFLDACRIWQDPVPSLTFATVNHDADIRVAWFAGHHGEAPDVPFDGLGRQLAHAWGQPHAYAGEVHLDLSEVWSTDDPASGNADFVTQLAHELGHVFGLRHSSDRESLMYPTFSAGEIKRRLSATDRTAILKLYP